MAPSDYNHPFYPYPQCIEYGGNIIEICCPACDGNARRDPPFSYYNQVAGIAKHWNDVHLEDGEDRISAFEFIVRFEADFRVITAHEEELVRQGDGHLVFERKPTAKTDGEEVKPKAVPAGLLIPGYPMIAQKADGTYVALSCNECGGNARLSRGELGAKKRGRPYKLIFMSGLVGLMCHIREAHKVTDITKTWALANCSTPITTQRYLELKTDMDGGKIVMVEGVNREVESIETASSSDDSEDEDAVAQDEDDA